MKDWIKDCKKCGNEAVPHRDRTSEGKHYPYAYCKQCESEKRCAQKKAAYRPNKQRAYQIEGVTEQELDEMLASQQHGCAICGKTGNLHLDHAHGHCKNKLGCADCIRGFLCPQCNQALGLLADSTERLAAAIEYLELDKRPARRGLRPTV